MLSQFGECKKLLSLDMLQILFKLTFEDPVFDKHLIRQMISFPFFIH